MDASDSNAGESCHISEVKVHNAAVEANSSPVIEKFVENECAIALIPERPTWFRSRTASTV